MTASIPPGTPNPAWLRSTQRPGRSLAIGILTALVVLGMLLLLVLALSGLIWTPWQTFPAQTSEAGVLAEHGFNLIVGIDVAAPVALGVIVCGHVALLLIRRRVRLRTESRGPRTVFVTLLLLGGLVVGYGMLVMQIVFALTVKLTD